MIYFYPISPGPSHFSTIQPLAAKEKTGHPFLFIFLKDKNVPLLALVICEHILFQACIAQ